MNLTLFSRLLAVCLLFSFTGALAQKTNTAALQRPRLVVGIVVDQMRWDYLYRYYERYGDKGFRRMLREGFTCENTLIDYVPTVTGVGHTTIYTGTVPAIHGIAGNDFIDNATGRTVYCTEDTTVQTVGSTSTAGRMSPRNMLSTTIGDELKLATNFRAKVIGIALKDRGSILPAGHAADAAYWLDNGTGKWITSTYYMKALPAWVQQFNNRNLPEQYLKKNWTTLYDSNTYVQSAPDNNAYEGPFNGQTAPTLPLMTERMFTNNYDLVRSTPYGNDLTLDMAKAAIENEKLGADAITDLLAVSFSSPDYIGHRFGVNAVETEDTYLRLDRTLADFFAYLDEKVGKGAYTVFLSADHGAAHNPIFMADHKLPSTLWSGSSMVRRLNEQLEVTFKVKNLVSGLMNSKVNLNYGAIRLNNIDEAALRRACVAFLQQQPEIAFVADLDQIGNAPIPAELKNRIINGYSRQRSGPIQYITHPAVFSGARTGTTHGTWNAFDAHIPLVWMGWGIRQGASSRQTHMSDIASTLSALLHIQMPNGNIGHPIREVLKNE